MGVKTYKEIFSIAKQMVEGTFDFDSISEEEIEELKSEAGKMRAVAESLRAYIDLEAGSRDKALQDEIDLIAQMNVKEEN